MNAASNEPDFKGRPMAGSVKQFRSETKITFEIDNIGERIQRAEESKDRLLHSIDSPTYRIEYMSAPEVKDVWKAYIKVYLNPMSTENENSDHIGVFLCSASEENKTVLVRRSMKFIGGKKEFTLEGRAREFAPPNRPNSGSSWGCKRCLAKSDLGNSKLTIVADICILSDHFETSPAPVTPDLTKGRGLGSWITDEDFVSRHADFLVQARHGEQIACFKAVLAARSPVFRAMFENGLCREVEERELVIPDFGHTTLKLFVNFLAQDEVDFEAVSPEEREADEETNDAILRNLLLLADKYDVPDLKNYTQFHLAKSVSGPTFSPCLTHPHSVTWRSMFKSFIP